MDYLTLYANAKEVHTDRIHACIGTLSQGGSCKLYNENFKAYNQNKRAELFNRMNIPEINEKVINLNANKLLHEKNKQSEFLREIIMR